MEEKAFKRSQILYILFAALEYLIYILVSGSFLATLTKELGFSDSLTGILSAIITLGCLFQLLSLYIQRTKVKKLVITSTILNQLLFMALYLIALTNLTQQVKIVLFVIIIVVAYFIYNIVGPKKISWLMSLVDNRQRGIFTANKEIISLIFGMVFSFVMGIIVDHFAEIGQLKTAFIISAGVIFFLMIANALSLLFTVEKELPPTPPQNMKQTIVELIHNKNILSVTIVFVLYYISSGISTPFYGTYQISELGMSLKFVSAIVICGSVARISVSKFWGRYADKNSFAAMTEKCFLFFGLSQVCVILAGPKTGNIMFALYNIFYGMALGGLNSALMNLVFDYVPIEKRADSFAITQAAAGLFGFLSTLCISPLISLIQKKHIFLFGIPIYAQQIVTAIALVFTIFTILYVRKVLIKATRMEL